MPPLHRRRYGLIVHKALASTVRRNILLSLQKKDKYLSEVAEEVKRKPQTIDFHLNLLEEIGLVESHTKNGKKYYKLSDKKVLDFIRHHQPLPHRFHPKPPHEMVHDMWEDMKKRLDRIEKRLENIEKK